MGTYITETEETTDKAQTPFLGQTLFLEETPEPRDWNGLHAAESCSRDAARGPPAQKRGPAAG